MTIRISQARFLSIVAPFAATKDRRPYLNGVHFMRHSAGGLRITATSGPVLLDIHDAEGSYDLAEPDCIIEIPREALSAAKKRGAQDEPVTFTDLAAGTPTTIAVRAGAITTRCKVIDGKYPDVDRVIPKAPPEKLEQAAFNGRYLAQFCDVVRMLPPVTTEKLPVAVLLHMAGPFAALVTYHGHPHIRGAIMPIRI